MEMLRTLGALGVPVGIAIAVISCGSDEPPVSSFSYVETRRGNIDGRAIDDREEGFYQAPDSVHVVGNAEYSPFGLEEIVIQSRVWTRDASGWSVTDLEYACYTAMDKAEWVLSLDEWNFADLTDEGAGPRVAGENTRRYGWASGDAGRNFILASELTNDSPELQAHMREVFGELQGQWRFVVGENTGRVYFYRLDLTGPKLTQQTEITVEYDVPVNIQAPQSVEVVEKPGIECEFDDTKLPWFAAAAAAILLPILFLVGAAFVWPRSV
jgi:hypothetical protein